MAEAASEDIVTCHGAGWSLSLSVFAQKLGPVTITNRDLISSSDQTKRV